MFFQVVKKRTSIDHSHTAHPIGLHSLEYPPDNRIVDPLPVNSQLPEIGLNGHARVGGGRHVVAPVRQRPVRDSSLDLVRNSIEQRDRKIKESQNRVQNTIDYTVPRIPTVSTAVFNPKENDGQNHPRNQPVQNNYLKIKVDPAKWRQVSSSQDQINLRRSQVYHNGISVNQSQEIKRTVKRSAEVNLRNSQLQKSQVEPYVPAAPSSSVYDSLNRKRKEVLCTEVAKYFFQKVVDPIRVQTFAKVLVDGLHLASQIKKEECIYFGKKVTLPDLPISQSRPKPTLLIEPIYVLSMLNPSYTPSPPTTTLTPPTPEYLLRPGASQFLHSLSTHWEIILYTSRKRVNVVSLVEMIDPNHSIISAILDRKNCHATAQNKCVKDVGVVGNRDPERCVLLDYKPQNVAFSLDNALILVHWNGSSTDNELEDLGRYLEYLSEEDRPAKANRVCYDYSKILSMATKG